MRNNWITEWVSNWRVCISVDHHSLNGPNKRTWSCAMNGVTTICGNNLMDEFPLFCTAWMVSWLCTAQLGRALVHEQSIYCPHGLHVFTSVYNPVCADHVWNNQCDFQCVIVAQSLVTLTNQFIYRTQNTNVISPLLSKHDLIRLPSKTQ